MGKIVISLRRMNLLLLITMLIFIFGCSKLATPPRDTEGSKPGQDLSQTPRQQNQETEHVNNYQKVFEQLFPDTKFSLKGSNGILTAKGETYFIEQLIYGQFLGQGDQYLVIVRRPPEELAHALGFYSADLGVFDGKSQALLTPIKHFSSDLGYINLFKGQKHAYVFFSGNATFQGWTSWSGGLYKITDNQWVEVWPGDVDFWKDRAVQVGQDRLILYKIKNNLDQDSESILSSELILEQELLWDPVQEKFIPAH